MVRLQAIALCAAGCISVEHREPVDMSAARQITLGQTHEEVRALVGGPHHMTRTFEHPKGCFERWSYVESELVSWVRDYDALIVDFDTEGRVCDITSLRALESPRQTNKSPSIGTE